MLDPAFALLGTPVTWLELVAFALALACVACGIREVHWAWPLTLASSLLYAWLFVASRLYGEATLQGFFALIALWGWWQWLRPNARSSAKGGLRISSLARPGMLALVLGWLAGWLLLGVALQTFTDTDVPFLDAFPTAGSVLGQLMLGRKVLQNWQVWIVVNLASVGLFAFKGLWLTALLYAVFAAMAWIGLRQWRSRVDARTGATPPPAAATA